MKFCYLDESGTGDEPYAVMVGVVVDAQRMHVTKKDWASLLVHLSDLIGREVTEIHTRDFYRGNGPWRNLNGEMRSRIIGDIFGWLQERKHDIVYSAVDKRKFNAEFPGERHRDDIGSLWRFMALHVCLAIQRHHQKQDKNKGNTVLVFDNEEQQATEFLALVRNPPPWTDTYCSRARRQDQLDQIVDVPYFGDSRHVGLIQLADVVSFFLRRYIEIVEGAVPPRYDCEEALVRAWAETALERAIPKASMYQAKARCDCCDLFYRYAPRCII